MCWCDGPGKRSATAEGERQTDDRRSPLFPDGIDELPFRLQVKLLTVLPVTLIGVAVPWKGDVKPITPGPIPRYMCGARPAAWEGRRSE